MLRIGYMIYLFLKLLIWFKAYIDDKGHFIAFPWSESRKCILVILTFVTFIVVFGVIERVGCPDSTLSFPFLNRLPQKHQLSSFVIVLISTTKGGSPSSQCLLETWNSSSESYFCLLGRVSFVIVCRQLDNGSVDHLQIEAKSSPNYMLQL